MPLLAILFLLVLSCEKESDAPSLAVPGFELDEKKNPIIGENFAFISGRIWLDGGSPIVETGVCWAIKESTDENEFQFPDKNGENVVVGYEENMVAKTRIKGLPILDTVYFVRTYAINQDGQIGYSYPFKFSNDLSRYNFND